MVYAVGLTDNHRAPWLATLGKFWHVRVQVPGDATLDITVAAGGIAAPVSLTGPSPGCMAGSFGAPTPVLVRAPLLGAAGEGHEGYWGAPSGHHDLAPTVRVGNAQRGCFQARTDDGGGRGMRRGKGGRG